MRSAMYACGHLDQQSTGYAGLMSLNPHESNTSYQQMIARASNCHDQLASESDAKSDSEFIDPKLAETIRLLNAVFREPGGDDITVSLLGEDPPQAEQGIPDKIQRFAIRGVLGSGGFATVYRGFDEVLQREVAIKSLRKNETRNAPDEQRLVEARAAARLSHPNLVPIYEVLDLDGQLHLVAEFCDGPTLSSWLKKHGDQLTATDSVEILIRLASAIEHAHSRSLVHRDIKPANVILVMTPGDPKLPFEPRLTDFGLVRDLNQTIDVKTADRLVGTFRYMAPEQFLHTQWEHNESCDQYALGVLLYRLLTGHMPHAEKSGIELVEAVCAHPPSRLRTMNASVPLDAEAICLRCLQCEPESRYPSVTHLIDDLRRFQQGLEVTTRPRGIAERSVATFRRHPIEAAMLAMMLVAIVSAAAISMSQNRVLKKQSQRLLAAVDRAGSAERIAEESLAKERQQRELAVQSQIRVQRIALRSDLRLGFASLARGDVPDTLSTITRLEQHAGVAIENDFAVRLLKMLAAEGTSRLQRMEINGGSTIAQSPVVEIVPIKSKAQTCIAYLGGIVRIIDDASGQTVRQFQAPADKHIRALAVTPGGNRIAVGLCDPPGVRPGFSVNEIYVYEQNKHAYELDELAPRFKRGGFPTTIESLAFLADSDQLAVGCRYEPVTVISLTDRTLKKTFPADRRQRELLVSPDIKRITFIDEQDKFVQLDAATHEVLRRIRVQASSKLHRETLPNIHRITISHDQRFAALTVGYADMIRVALVDLSATTRPSGGDGLEIAQMVMLDASSSIARAIAFSQDDSQLFVGSEAGDLIRYDVAEILVAGEASSVAQPTCLDRRVIHQGSIFQLAVDSRGRILSGGEDGEVSLVDQTVTDRDLLTIAPATALIVMDGTMVFTGHVNGSVYQTEIHTGQSKVILKPGKATVSKLALDPQGEILIVGRVDGTMLFWDLKRCEKLSQARARDDESHTRIAVESITLNAEGTKAVVSVGGFALRVFKIDRSEIKPTVSLVSEQELGGSIDAVWFADSESVVLLGEVTRRWDQLKAAQLDMLGEQSTVPGVQGITSMTADPVKHVAYTGARDGRIRRHDETGLVIATSDRWPRPAIPQGNDGVIRSLSLDATNRYLIAGDETGHLSIWDATTLQHLGTLPTEATSISLPIREIQLAPDNAWLTYLPAHALNATGPPQPFRPKCIVLD